MLKNIFKIAAASTALLFVTPVIGGAPGDKPAADPAAAAASQADAVALPAFNKRSEPAIKLDLFTINYEVRFTGLSGIASLSLKKAEAPNEYLYQVESQAKGIARLLQSNRATEKSRFIVNADGLTPVRYEFDGGSGKDSDRSAIDFDWERSTASSVHEGEPAELRIETHIKDRLSADLQTVLELRAGEMPEAQHIAYRNSIRSYDLIQSGEETITVPAGTFKTVKFLRHREDSKRSTMIWFAVDAGFLPIRIEQRKNDKPNATMSAVEILGPGAAGAGN
jgi:hypothetical protein